jgi:hypothetical protein
MSSSSVVLCIQYLHYLELTLDNHVRHQRAFRYESAGNLVCRVPHH